MDLQLKGNVLWSQGVQAGLENRSQKLLLGRCPGNRSRQAGGRGKTRGGGDHNGGWNGDGGNRRSWER